MMSFFSRIAQFIQSGTHCLFQLHIDIQSPSSSYRGRELSQVFDRQATFNGYAVCAEPIGH